jgi:SnoaL-like domain
MTSYPLAQPDIEQLRNLKARYCRYADAKRWTDVAALFTPDALIRFYDVDGDLANEVRAADFADTIGTRVGAGQPIHHVFSHEIEITGPDTARGIWAMEDLIVHDKSLEPDAPFMRMHGFGHYRETYRRLASGWRIASVELTRLRMEFTY